jgi:hypothetical protein
MLQQMAGQQLGIGPEVLPLELLASELGLNAADFGISQLKYGDFVNELEQMATGLKPGPSGPISQNEPGILDLLQTGVEHLGPTLLEMLPELVMFLL